MKIRDRVKEFRRVKASELVPHPKNWRSHSRYQRDVLKGVLGEIGYADALLTRRLSDGTLQLIDGHLRAEATPNAMVPVLVLDLNDAEAEKVLLTHDPIASLAGIETESLAGLLDRATTENKAVEDLFGKLSRDLDQAIETENHVPAEIEVPESYQVVVECVDADDQQQIYEQLTAGGHRCRVLTL